MTPRINWFTRERRTWLVIVAFAGVIGFGTGNGHTTHGAVVNISNQLGQKTATLKKLQTKEIPQLKAEAGCEHWRAEVTEGVAKQAITSANSETVPVPDASDIPQDCSHPKE